MVGGHNVAWKVPVAGEGSASPVIWEDQIFLLSAVPVGAAGGPAVEPSITDPLTAGAGNATRAETDTASHDVPADPMLTASGDAASQRGQGGGRQGSPPPVMDYTVMSLNRADGTVRWSRVARREAPHEGKQNNNSWASSSAITGYRGNALRAVRLAEAMGEIDDSAAILWEYNEDTPYVPSPLLYDGTLYFLSSNSPILTAIDVATGEPHYGPARLDGLQEIYSSPVGAAGRVYLVDRDGGALVIEIGATLEVLANNVLDDGFEASPAIVDGELYLRGRRYLYRIEESGPPPR